MSRSAQEILSQEFLLTRAKILEVAAFYDRLSCQQVAGQQGASADDPAMQQLQAACRILTDEEDNKAARVQLLFSREFDPQWREQFGI